MKATLFLRRGGALAIDVAVVFALDFFITIGLSATPFLGVTIGQLEERLRWPLIAIYFIGFWMTGGTPGMRQMGLVLERMGGELPPTLIAAIVRFAILGGIVALAGATLLLWILPYGVACAFGLYPHDIAARTTVRRKSQELNAVSRTVSRSAYAIGLFFFGLMVVGVLLGLMFGGFGDRPL